MRREERTWRLIRSGFLPGAMNMALDDALLQAVVDGDSPPVLRLYRWQPATLTLGYAQKIDAGVDLAACRAAGLDVVRRPTGGRAVLHAQEMTYAVVAPCTPPFGSGVSGNYRVIAGVLQMALQQLGLAAELVPGQTRSQQGQAVCFTAPAQYELLIDGCKVAGCAQKRRGGAFLQHGSMPLELDLALLGRILPGPYGEALPGRFRGIGWLNRFAPRSLAVEAVEAALVASFTRAFNVSFEESRPSRRECERAEALCGRYYADPYWTLHGSGGGVGGKWG